MSAKASKKRIFTVYSILIILAGLGFMNLHAQEKNLNCSNTKVESILSVNLHNRTTVVKLENGKIDTSHSAVALKVGDNYRYCEAK